MPQLPDEILLHIVQSLPSTSDLLLPRDHEKFRTATRTLATVCRVSKTLCSFAQPLLFRAYLLKHVPHPRDHASISDREHRKLQEFLRTLIQRPDLAAKVESLRFEDFSYDTIDGIIGRIGCNEDDRILDPVLADVFERASYIIPPPRPARRTDGSLFTYHHNWQDRWRAGLRRANLDAVITLVLVLVPNLRTLDVLSNDERHAEDFLHMCSQLFEPPQSDELNPLPYGSRRVLRALRRRLWPSQASSSFPSSSSSSSFSSSFSSFSSSTGPPPVLSRLESLAARTVSDGPMRMLDEGCDTIFYRCISLIRLPTLTSLTLHNIRDYPIITAVEYDLPLDHILHLRFEGCYIPFDFYHALVSSCGRLQSLWMAFPHDAEISLGAGFLACFAEKAETLQRLFLTMPDVWTSMIVLEPFDLRCLSSLRYLEINQPPLWFRQTKFSQTLPTSLERLTVRYVTYHFAPHLDIFLEDVRRFTRLERFTIVLHCETEAEEWFVNARLRNLIVELKRLGIELWIGAENTESIHLHRLEAL